MLAFFIPTQALTLLMNQCSFQFGVALSSDILPKLRTATKQPSKMDELTPFQLYLGNLSTQAWVAIGSHVVINILLGTAFKDGFIQEICSCNKKVVP